MPTFIFVSLVLLLVPATEAGIRTWIDCDNSAGLDGVRDVDDALALVQALHSPELEVIGISATFGNAPVAQSVRVTNSMLSRFFNTRRLEAWPGAAAPDPVMGEDMESSGTSEAVEKMWQALVSHTRVTILALGALTNIATLLRKHPTAAEHIERIVFVGGRRPGFLFRVGTWNSEVLADLNFEKDPAAAQEVLASSVPLLLAPFELSSKLALTQTDLDALRGHSERGSLSTESATSIQSWLAAVSQPWLDFFAEAFRVEYFNPFDCLAVLAVTHPDLVLCATLHAWVEMGPSDQVSLKFSAHSDGDPAQHGHGVPSKLYLHVGDGGSEGEPRTRTVEYCHTPDPDAKKVLMARLLRSSDASPGSSEL